jgi:hypothetical protein
VSHTGGAWATSRVDVGGLQNLDTNFNKFGHPTSYNILCSRAPSWTFLDLLGTMY